MNNGTIATVHHQPTSGQSDDISALAKALSSAQSEIRYASKGSVNPHFKSRYADLSEVWDACRAALANNKLSITQTTDCSADDMYLVTTLMHESGQWIRGVYPVRPVKMDPQGYGSAITYARRYALSAMVGVVADDDDDGNGASRNRPSVRQVQPSVQHAAKDDPRLTTILNAYAAATDEATVEKVREQAMGMHKEAAFSNEDKTKLAAAKAEAMDRVRGVAA